MLFKMTFSRSSHKTSAPHTPITTPLSAPALRATVPDDPGKVAATATRGLESPDCNQQTPSLLPTLRISTFGSKIHNPNSVLNHHITKNYCQNLSFAYLGSNFSKNKAQKPYLHLNNYCQTQRIHTFGSKTHKLPPISVQHITNFYCQKPNIAHFGSKDIFAIIRGQLFVLQRK